MMEKLKRYMFSCCQDRSRSLDSSCASTMPNLFQEQTRAYFGGMIILLPFSFALSSSWFLCFGIPSVDKVPPPGPLSSPHWVPSPSPDASSCQSWLSSVDPACRESFTVCVSPLVPDHLSGHQLWMRWKLKRKDFVSILPSRHLDTAGFTQSLSSSRTLFSSSLG